MYRGTPLLILVSVAMAVTLLAPRAPEALAHAELFRIGDVRVEGNAYLTREEVLEVLRLSPDGSIWDDPKPMETRLEGHPLVLSARVYRSFPNGLSVEVVERNPVALVSTPVLVPIDREGRFLPIDPAGHRLDLPLVARHRQGAGRDQSDAIAALTPAELRTVAAEVERLAEIDPDLLASVSDLALDGGGDVLLRLGEPSVTLRYRPPLAPRRLQEGLRVLGDALEREPDLIPASVDLRFADQVVVQFFESREP